MQNDLEITSKSKFWTRNVGVWTKPHVASECIAQEIRCTYRLCAEKKNSDSGEPEPNLNLNLHSRLDSAIHYDMGPSVLIVPIWDYTFDGIN